MGPQYVAFRRDSMRAPDTPPMKRNVFLAALACTLSTGVGSAMAARTVPLDPSACRIDELFAHGFGEDGDVETGLLTRQFAGRRYFLVVPPGYRSARAHPLLLSLHGTGGNLAGAESNALAIAQMWQPIARARGMLVVVPIGISAAGSWYPPVDFPYLDLLRANVASEFGLDVRRHYLWGFSAGGHVGHAYALQRTDQIAGYAVAAGKLSAYACTPENCPAYLAAAPRKVPVDISTGFSDPYVTVNEISADQGRFSDAGWQYGTDLWVRGLAGQGHTYSSSQLTDSWNTLCQFGVGPD